MSILHASASAKADSHDQLMFDPERYRKDFPILARKLHQGIPLAFLDNAASAQRPEVVIEAMSDCYRRYYANVHRGIHSLSEESTAAYEQARQTVAGFINAALSCEIIFTAGATAAINTVARSWGDANLKSGDTILLTIAEHHANIVPWHQLAQRTGCKVEFLALEDDFTISDSSVKAAIEKYSPKLFAFVTTSNVLGTEFPVRSWVKMGHDSGAVVLVDAAQAAPNSVVDVRQWDADFVVFSGHKVCGPSGIGVLYGKERLLESMPPFMGGGGMISRVTTSGFESAALPDKFEAGTPPIVEAIGLAAAVTYLSEIGLDRIHQHEKRLADRADAELRQLDGIRIIGPMPENKAGIVSFHLSRPHSHDIAQMLDNDGIAVRAGHHCTMPLHQSLGISASTRASFFLYNTMEEVDRLIDAVKKIQKRFAPSGRKRKQ
jgi:cysteine desulfurase / selenocysteine lyase